MSLVTACLVLLVQTPSVSYTTRGAMLGVIVRDLAALTGKPLKIAASADDEVLVIRAKDVPEKELLDRVAQATGTKWNEQTWTLELDPKARAAKQAENAEIRRKHFAELISWYQDKGKNQPAITSSLVAQEVQDLKTAVPDPAKGFGGSPAVEKQVKQIQFRSPITRLGGKILTLIGAQELARIGRDERVVFSTSPNRFQRRLPREAFAAFETARAEIQTLEQVLGKPSGRFSAPSAGSAPGSTEDLRHANEIREAYGLNDPSAIFTPNPITQVLVVVTSQQSIRGELDVRFIGLNEQNTEVFRLDGTDLMNSVEWARRDNPKEPAAESGMEVLRPSKESEFFGKWASTYLNAGFDEETDFVQAPRDPEFEKMLTRPDLFEPLALSLGDRLVQWAELKEKNVVARLADWADLMDVHSERDTIPAARFWDSLSQTHTSSQAEGWTLVQPSYPTMDFGDSVNRRALSRLMTGLCEKGHSTLEEQWTYASDRNCLMNMSRFDSEYVGIAPTTFAFNPSYQVFSNKRFLRFLAALTPHQWKLLKSGQSIRGLNGEQIARLTEEVYQNEDALIEDDSEVEMAYERELARLSQSLQSQGLTDEQIGEAMEERIRELTRQDSARTTEPTLLLPNGLPGNIEVECRTTRRILLACSEKPGDRIYFLEPEEFGYSRGYAQTAEGVKEYGPYLRLKHFQVANGVTYRFFINLGPRVIYGNSLEETDYDPRSPKYSLDQLPADILKSIRDAEKEGMEEDPGDRPFEPLGKLQLRLHAGPL